MIKFSDSCCSRFYSRLAQCTVGWNCIRLTHSFQRHKPLSQYSTHQFHILVLHILCNGGLTGIFRYYKALLQVALLVCPSIRPSIFSLIASNSSLCPLLIRGLKLTLSSVSFPDMRLLSFMRCAQAVSWHKNAKFMSAACINSWFPRIVSGRWQF